jgi:Coatomer gamma subunit appendage platform subdomain
MRCWCLKLLRVADQISQTAPDLRFCLQIRQAVPELAALGPVFKSSTPTLLTEEGTEYSVTATKHVTDAAVVFQFLCSNTVEEQARVPRHPRCMPVLS